MQMTLHRSEAFLIVATMLGLFAWGGLRYDVVALLSLAAALLTGVVPADKAFLGFGSPVIIIIASVLVLSRAIAISGVIELATRRLLRRLHSASAQIGTLTACVAGFLHLRNRRLHSQSLGHLYRLRGNRRHRARHRLHLAGLDPHPMVP
jgi:di/tricarboxylate transporter